MRGWKVDDWKPTDRSVSYKVFDFLLTVCFRTPCSISPHVSFSHMLFYVTSSHIDKLPTHLPYPLLFSIKKWYIFPWLKRVKEKGRLKKREGEMRGRFDYSPFKLFSYLIKNVIIKMHHWICSLTTQIYFMLKYYT